MSATAKKIDKIGLIAGGGALPEQLLKVCDQKEIEVFVVGLKGQADPRVLRGRDHMQARPGAAGAIIKELQKRKIKDLVLIGSLRRPSLKELRPDLLTAAFMARLGFKVRGDDGLLKAIKGELTRRGFTIHGVQDFAADLLTPPGPLSRAKPKKAFYGDIIHAIQTLRHLSACDIGQALVVQEGIILGVEAAEGTDELIRRCASYKRTGRGPVLVKLAKAGQEKDLDLPTIGPETIKRAAEKGYAGIIIHAGNSLLVEPEIISHLADEAGLFVYAVNPDQLPDGW